MSEMPDLFEPILGWRIWLTSREGLLTGTVQAQIWPPHERMTTACLPYRRQLGSFVGFEYDPDNHLGADGMLLPAPVIMCRCGVYGYKSRERMESHLADLYLHFPSHILCWGSVKLWGKVIEHEEGYRAQYAYPHELYMERSTMAARVSYRYGVTCKQAKPPQDSPSAFDYGVMMFGSGAGGLKALFNTLSFAPPIRFKGIPLQLPPPPIPPQLVGADPWQVRQYAGGRLPVMLTDPKQTLRALLYLSDAKRLFGDALVAQSQKFEKETR